MIRFLVLVLVNTRNINVTSRVHLSATGTRIRLNRLPHDKVTLLSRSNSVSRSIATVILSGNDELRRRTATATTKIMRTAIRKLGGFRRDTRCTQQHVRFTDILTLR